MPRSQYLEELLRPSLGTRALDTLLTPLGTAGRVLDTPGSVIRGLAYGDPQRALSGIFDTSQRVSGNELLGGAPDEFSWRGLGAEVALDPLNFLAIGKTTKAGELLKRSKNLDAAIEAERAIGAEIPSVGKRLFQNTRKLDNISDELTQMGKAGQRYGDTLAEQAKYGQRSLLSFDVPFTDINVPLIKGEGAFKALGKTGEGIKAIPGMDKVGHAANTAFNTNYNPKTRKTMNAVEKALKFEHQALKRESETRAEQAVTMLYKIRDDLAKKYNLTGTQADHKLAMAAEKGELGGIPEIGQFVKPYVRITEDLLREGIYEGLPGMQGLESGLGYSPHYLTPEGAEFFKKRMNSTGKRKEFLRSLRSNIPGFTLKRKLMPDQAIPEINALAREKYGIDFDIMNPNIIDNLGKRMLIQGNAVADRRLTEGYMKAFGLTKGQRDEIPKVFLSRRQMVNAPSLFKKLADKSRGPTITTAFHLGTEKEALVPIVDPMTGVPMAHVWSYKDNVLRWKPDESQKAINKLFDAADAPRYIPRDIASNLKRQLTEVNTPEFAKKFVSVVDTVNAFYRGALTTMFPAYHVRNDLSGMFMNALAGVVNPKEYLEAFAGLRRMSNEESETLRGLGVLGKGQHEETRRMIEASKLHQWNKSAALPAKAYQKMQHLGQATDNLNRYALYKHMLKKGMTPSEAAMEVKKYHFDYSDLTPTEKNVMRRSILFYTFMRNNIPLMLKQVVENHRAVTLYGRLTGQTNVNIQEPTWMLNSFFVGKDDEGDPMRINLGLPMQDADKFNTEGKGLQRFAQIFASMFTPLAVTPIETLSGKSLFYDKALEGNTVERVLKSSPFARAAGTWERGQQNPGPELLRLLTSLNVQSPSPKEIARENQLAAVKRKLKDLVKEGRARELPVFAKRGETPDKDLQLLNKRLAHLLSK